MEIQKIRIDMHLAKISNIPRTEAQKLISNGCVKVNNKIINKNNQLINPLVDKIEINKINSKKENTKNEINFSIKPFNSNLEIVYEDEYLFIVNKDSGIMVHPTTFNETNTLANIIKYHISKNNINSKIDNIRMGICHRLDKDTSGLIVVAKDDLTYQKMVNLFKDNKVEKTYTALLFGNLESKQLDVDAPIKRIDGTNKREVSTDSDAKDSFSSFTLLKQYEKFCLVEIKIKTGRTHQIRVHAKYIKHNVINDPIYGVSKNTTKYGQYLVANKIKFINPISNKLISVSIDLPKEFNDYIKKNG